MTSLFKIMGNPRHHYIPLIFSTHKHSQHILRFAHTEVEPICHKFGILWPTPSLNQNTWHTRSLQYETRFGRSLLSPVHRSGPDYLSDRPYGASVTIDTHTASKWTNDGYDKLSVSRGVGEERPKRFNSNEGHSWQVAGSSTRRGSKPVSQLANNTLVKAVSILSTRS